MARLLRPTGRRGAARRRGDPQAVRPARWRAPSACCRRPRSRPRASPSSTWSAAAGTRTRVPSGAGRREDEAAVAEALELTGTGDLADRVVDELSGGQRQRVWIAMALAQGTDLLLLDEPTTYLDVAHQIEMLDLLADLNPGRGTTVVMVLHDLNLAARYADHLVAMKSGRDRRRGRARRRRHRGDGARGLRPRQPGDHRPRLAHPAGRPGRTPPQPGPGRDPTMTMTTNHSLPMILDEVEVSRPSSGSRRRYVRVELGSPGARRLRRRRPALRPADQAGVPQRRRATCRRSPAPTSRGSAPGWRSRRPSAATCAPTPCATSAAPASTPGWSSTSCCTSRTARPDPARPGRRGRRSATGWSRWRRGAARSTAASSSTPARPSRCCWSPTRPPYRRSAASSRTCRPRPAGRPSWRFPSRAT